ncbi:MULTISPECIES: thermonuclease family protein [Brachybacterium]|uniref:thermonuclease family protein n=1 Tax=Brachybacterium TaxID=43668 RepID=UPI003FD60E9D
MDTADHPAPTGSTVSRALALLVLALTAAACTPLAQTPSPPPQPQPTQEVATVDYVIDGDTIDVTTPTGETQRVRLLGINTPEVSHDDEPGQCGGEAATEQLRALLPEGTSVHLQADTTADDQDRYGRLLRYVELETGADIGRELISAGYAHAWAPASAPDPDRLDAYQDATDEAEAANTGSWATCPNLGQSR